VWDDIHNHYTYGELQKNPKKPTIISDIDGTIINDQERQLLANQNSFNNADWWAIYNNPINFNLDRPIESMRQLLRTYKNGIVYLTYRPESLRKMTQWQLHHMGFPSGQLIMCPDEDYHNKKPADFKLEVITRLKKCGHKIERILEDDLAVAEKLGQAGYTVISPDTVHSSRENPIKMQKLQVKAHPLQKLAAEWKDQRGWKDLTFAEAMSMLKSKKAVMSLKFDGELECFAVDLKKGIKVGKKRYKCVIANKTTMSHKKEGGVWHEEMRTGKIRTGGPVCKELIQICRRNHIRRIVGFAELCGHNLGKRVPFGDTASYIASTEQSVWRKHVRFAIFDMYALNGKMKNKKPYYSKMRFLQKRFSGNYVQVVPFKYGGAKTFRMVWNRWIVRQKNEGVVITIGQMAYKVKPQLSVDCAIIGLKKTGVRWAEKKLASAFPCAVMDKKGNLIVCREPN
jgi:hypothetical protein